MTTEMGASMSTATEASMSPNPTTSLATTAAAFKSTLEAAVGPVEQFHAQTDEGASYLGFSKGDRLLVTVQPYAAGWAVVLQDGRSEVEVISYGETPTLAMQRAEFSDSSL
jgi:hypothetical protein